MRRLVGCLVLSLAWQSASAGPEREFWGWFEANAERLAARPQAVETLEDMSFWLGKIDPGLSYEIVAGGRKAELVLSADGRLDLFPLVENLVDQAPGLKGWLVTAMRRRQRRLFTVTVDGLVLDPATVHFDLYEDGFRYGVVLYVPDMMDDRLEDYRTAAMRLMSQSIGEREVGAWIGFVDVDRHGVRDMEFSQPFSRFRETFDGLRK